MSSKLCSFDYKELERDKTIKPQQKEISAQVEVTQRSQI